MTFSRCELKHRADGSGSQRVPRGKQPCLRVTGDLKRTLVFVWPISARMAAFQPRQCGVAVCVLVAQVTDVRSYEEARGNAQAGLVRGGYQWATVYLIHRFIGC